MERIIPTSFGRVISIDGGKTSQSPETKPEYFGVEIIGPAIPYALLGITGFEEQDLNDAEQFTGEQVATMEQEDWQPVNHKSQHYSNKPAHFARSMHHQPNHSKHLRILNNTDLL